ncbi:MAG: replication-associated recombination protein A [Bacteroidia bacterium]|nr:MAG: replication-associated recombination protein A [Bacteroidia bacterium]
MRPTSLDEIVGQDHLVGAHGVLRMAVANQHINSIIFWGPPGSGKTTLAQVIGLSLSMPLMQISAVNAGVKDIREVIEKAKYSNGAILFIDEIHRFNKSQQDALLHAVEKGIIILIGATTENPSFEVNNALLSRSQVYVLNELEISSLELLLERAMKQDDWLKSFSIQVKEKEALLQLSGGDARKLLNLFEAVVQAIYSQSKQLEISITNDWVEKIAQRKTTLYDKNGEQHYDIISAFIKSIRGSDPNGAVYWLARMIAGGEDVKFIARRLLISASEDIGNANPNALLLANATFDAVSKIGYPEARIILSQCAVYLASSPKSNASYMAINDAMQLVKMHGDLSVPLHIRNAPTKLMKDLDYCKEYKYSHDYENNFAPQEYLPEAISNKRIFNPGSNARENELRNYLKKLWKDKYGY